MYESLIPVKQKLEECNRILNDRMYEGDDPIGEEEFSKLTQVKVVIEKAIDLI